MKTLVLLVMMAIGVATILYFRVNVGMSWDEMSQASEGDVLRLLVIALVIVGGLAVTVAFMSKRD